MNCRSLSEVFSSRTIAGLTLLGTLAFVPSMSAQSTTAPPIVDFSLPSEFQIPPADQPCILSGKD